MCDNFDGPNAPFCSPTQGQQIPVGRTIDVTWDPRFFNSSETPFIRVQADFATTGADGVLQGTDGFTSDLIAVNVGRFSWNILNDYLSQGASTTAATLFFAEPSLVNTTTRGNRLLGPRVELVPATNQQPNGNPSNNNNNNNNNPNNNNRPPTNSSSNSINPIAVALPIVFGVLTLCFLGFCVWFKRRNPDFGRGFFTFRRRRWRGGPGGRAGRAGVLNPADDGANAFAIAKSRSQRIRGKDIQVVTTDMNGLRMNAMAMNGMAGNATDRDRNNVFREEVRRQDRARF